jgi:hypothetical protein
MVGEKANLMGLITSAKKLNAGAKSSITAKTFNFPRFLPTTA